MLLKEILKIFLENEKEGIILRNLEINFFIKI
jgi:hypothetical protein